MTSVLDIKIPDPDWPQDVPYDEDWDDLSVDARHQWARTRLADIALTYDDREMLGRFIYDGLDPRVLVAEHLAYAEAERKRGLAVWDVPVLEDPAFLYLHRRKREAAAKWTMGVQRKMTVPAGIKAPQLWMALKGDLPASPGGLVTGYIIREPVLVRRNTDGSRTFDLVVMET